MPEMTAITVITRVSTRGMKDRGSGWLRRIARWHLTHSLYAVTATTAPNTISGTPSTCQAPRHAGERRQQLHHPETGHHQGEGGTAPGQEGALVGEGVPGIGFGAIIG